MQIWVIYTYKNTKSIELMQSTKRNISEYWMKYFILFIWNKILQKGYGPKFVWKAGQKRAKTQTNDSADGLQSIRIGAFTITKGSKVIFCAVDSYLVLPSKGWKIVAQSWKAQEVSFWKVWQHGLNSSNCRSRPKLRL